MIASKSREAADAIENGVAERVEQVRSETDKTKTQAAERIRRIATQLRNMGDTLRDQDTLAASLADRAGDGIESVADYVSSSDPRAVMRDAEQLARQRPGLFFGGAFLVGLAAGRFLKSSRPEGSSYAEPRRFRESSDDYASARRGSARDWEPSTERERSSTRDSAEERLRQNYDAAFGRDVSSARGTTGSVTSGAGSVTPGATTGSGLGEPAPQTSTGQPAVSRPLDPGKGSGA